jgi:iron complex transport system substrate-binding protein
MTRTSLINAAALAAALAAAFTVARRPDRPGPTASPPSLTATRRAPIALPGGGFALPDTAGHLVPLRRYQRIVSTTLLTDRLLVALCEPDRVLAFSGAGGRSSPWSYQYAGKPTVEDLTALEPLVSLKPDLVLLSGFGAPGRVGKVRAAGIEVFDFGEMRGRATLGPIAESLAILLGAPERGLRFAEGFERRLRNVAATLGNRRPHTAIYLATIGPALYGGTVGTSYHDVLVGAGLVDAAAASFRDWPAYSAEQIIALAPQHLVTKIGMAATLCRYPGLDHLPACRVPAGVIELPPGLLDEPGPAMLDAAELLFSKVYGD